MSGLFYNARNLVVENGFVRNPNRYYLEEFYKQRPAVNAVLLNTHTGENESKLASAANKDFELLGENAASDKVTFSEDYGGILLTTANTSNTPNEQMIIAPHLASNQTAWTGIEWGVGNQVEWECAILFPEDPLVKNMIFWAGLKTKYLNIADAHKAGKDDAYFTFESSGSSQPKLLFVYTKNSSPYTTDLGINIEQSIIYRLRISIDNNRKISVFVNEVQYGLTNTSSISGSQTETNETQKSSQLTKPTSSAHINLVPYVGIEQLGNSADKLVLCYQKISRLLNKF